MSNQGKWIAGWIASIVAVILYFGVFSPGDDSGEAYQQQVQELSRQNDSLRGANVVLDQRVYALKNTADSLAAVAGKELVKIDEFKLEKDEKIRVIDTMGNTELFRFFAEFDTTDYRD